MATEKQQRIDPKRISGEASRKQPKNAKSRSRKPGGHPKAVVVPVATAGDWIAAARVRTLPLALAPVTLGAASAYVLSQQLDWLLAALCLTVAVTLQVGVNFANDYSDGVRGTDRVRVGPARLTASGAARPRTVLTVALVFFAIAAGAGIAVVILTQYFWLLAVGAACIAAAWFYTGGRRPYGYYGLGELFVFAFFGIVATAGTTFVLSGTVNIESWVAGTAIGLIASAVLMVNNIRDREPDAAAGKRTLAVLMGDLPSRIVFAVLLLAPFGILAFFVVFYLYAHFVYFVLLAAIPAILIGLTGKTPAELMLALKLSSLTALLFGLGLAAAIAF